jgi:Holliday junction resolvasome RuvABC DNA-binding subunit
MISYLEGTVLAVGLGRCTVLAGAVGYEIRFGISLDPTTGQTFKCWIVHSFSRDGEQTLYGYASPAEREYAQLATLTPGVGAGTAHKIVSTLGLTGFADMLITGKPSKVRGVSAATLAEVIKVVNGKFKGLGAAVTTDDSQHLKIHAALEAMGLDPADYERPIREVLATAIDESTSSLVSIILRKGNQ